jgi:hypothetical protein
VNGQPTFGITSSQKCWQYVWEMANVKMDHWEGNLQLKISTAACLPDKVTNYHFFLLWY